MACQEVYVSFEERLRRGSLASCTEFGDVELFYLIPALSGCGVASGSERLFASFAAWPKLALLLLPVLFMARPRVVRVLFPGVIPFAARACAELLPDRQEHGHAVGKRTRCVAGTAA